MYSNDFRLSEPRRLAHLPLVMETFRRSEMDLVIDHMCGTDSRMKVSHAECVGVILAGVFAGEHGLWRLQERLDVFDMETVMQDPGFSFDDFHDVRLGRALDAIYAAGPDRLLSEIALRVIAAHDLKTDFLHFDTTTLTCYGAYEEESDPFWSPEIEESAALLRDVPAAAPRQRHAEANGDGRLAPQLLRGYAKNHRHDLKQILYGSVVTRDGGVPLYGRAMQGNTSDVTAATEFLEHIRTALPDPGEHCFVADCKGWNPRVLAQAHAHQLRMLSRLPRNTGLSRSCVADFSEAQADACLLRRYDRKRKHWAWVAYQGRDAVYPFRAPLPAGEKGSGELIELPVRVVTCYSTALYRKKLKTLAVLRKREEKKRAKKQREWERKRWACETDAQVAAERLSSQQPFVSLHFEPTVIRYTETAKRTRRGRPSAQEVAPKSTQRYRLNIQVTATSDEDIHHRLKQAATYTLVRHRCPRWSISDQEMVGAYNDQWRIEHGFAWLKSKAAINPIFLENNSRIEALCVIYQLGLMIHTLIQRNCRRGLQEQQITLPYHRNKESDKITARFLYELFRNVTSQTVRINGKQQQYIHGLDDDVTPRALKAMNMSNGPYATNFSHDGKLK